MKTNLVIYPSEDFINKSIHFKNIFIDRYCHDQYENKNENNFFFSRNIDFDNRIKNFNLSNELFYEILEIVKIELNLIYKKNFNLKFFEILLGCWLRSFIQQFVNKYWNIIEINKTYKINNATIYDTSEFNFFTSETQTIQNATLDNFWNACIYSYILENLNLGIEFKLMKPSIKNFDDSMYLSQKTLNKSKMNLKKIIYDFYTNLANLVPNNSSFFMYNTGFNFLNEKKIDLMFGQIPRLYPSKFKFSYSSFDKNLRKKFNFEKYLKKNFQNESRFFNEIFNLIIKILANSLPIFIVEDFENLIKFSKNLNFPKNPKAICTSTAFESNEPFKFYLANKKFLDDKIKYFVYQHGGCYLTRLDNNFSNEYKTCDHFITWGEKTDISKTHNLKFVNYKLLNKKYFNKTKSQKFLIMIRSSGANTEPYDVYTEKLNQLNMTLDLCKKFPINLKKDTLIRAHYSFKKSKMKNYLNHLYGFNIDYSDFNYFDTINSSKLVLFNHDSTGMLETFAINKPTLCMWEAGNQHMNTFVLDDYDLLKKAEILFDDHNKLYDHLVKIWNDPLKWWYSDNVQTNLTKFVNLYTRLPDRNFSRNFKNLIKDNI